MTEREEIPLRRRAGLFGYETKFFDPHLADVSVHFCNDFLAKKLKLSHQACIIDCNSEQSGLVINRPAEGGYILAYYLSPLLLETISLKARR